MKPRMILLYGDSGSTKTSQCYHLAKHIYNTLGLTTRLIGANASDSAPFEDSGMIEKGTVDYFDVSNRELALADMRWLARGYWPRNVKHKDGSVGTKEYFRNDEQCLTTQAQWDKIGAVIVEGITGISSLLLNHMRMQEEGVGFKHSFKYEEMGEVFGGLQEGHYGLAQQELYKLIVQGYACLPVRYVIFTALIGKGENARKGSGSGKNRIVGEPLYGPKGAGQASTFEIPSWFMDTFHLDKVVEQVELPNGNRGGNVNGGTVKQEVERRVAWFTQHPDLDTGINYLAKPRILPELYPELIKRFPEGYVRLGFKRGIDVFYDFLEGLIKSEKSEKSEQIKVAGQEKGKGE